MNKVDTFLQSSIEVKTAKLLSDHFTQSSSQRLYAARNPEEETAMRRLRLLSPICPIVQRLFFLEARAARMVKAVVETKRMDELGRRRWAA